MEFVTTGDGSKTLYHAAVGEHYHSTHGALQESKHVFLQSGLVYFLNLYGHQECSILEVGFGTGLNFLMTADYAAEHHVRVDYCGIEAFPLPQETVSATGYSDFVDVEVWERFSEAYPRALTEQVALGSEMTLTIAPQKVLDFTSEKQFDVIYFDAFAAVHQPEMWNDETLAHVCRFLKPGGVFVTYAITGNLKRSMKALGFTIEKAPGAPGKREMLRAVKV